MMDQDRKVRRVEALVASKAKGNAPLAESVRIALEQEQTYQMPPKAA